jgi:hypothetical protein
VEGDEIGMLVWNMFTKTLFCSNCVDHRKLFMFSVEKLLYLIVSSQGGETNEGEWGNTGKNGNLIRR